LYQRDHRKKKKQTLNVQFYECHLQNRYSII